MCGITGILSTSLPLEATARSMADAMGHRGPDASGYYIDEYVSLGHRRLAIIDLSPQGNQPMYNADGRYVIVYNGELYNYKELREKLRALYPFKTNSDTEVILAAFRQWGPHCLQDFNGIFAFAIWDTRTRKLFVARDQLGVKPFYYYRTDTSFLFASELRGLLASKVLRPTLSLQGLTDFLSYQSVHEPSSMISGTYQLKAGHYAWVTDKSFVQSRYYKGSEVVQHHDCDHQRHKQNIKDLFMQAVNRQLVSDVPLAVFLSGGIDSSAIVAAAAQSSSGTINTFSIAFEEAKYNESKYARLVADKYKTNHVECKVPATIFIDQIEDALNAMSTPSGDGPNTYLISGLVKSAGIKVALSGLGGDELFAGYPGFMYYYRLQALQSKLPGWLRQGFGSVFTNFPNRKLQKMAELFSKPDFDIAYVYPAIRRIYHKSELLRLNELLGHCHDTIEAGLLSDSKNINQLPILSRYSLAELNNYTQNVLLEDADQMSMAHSIELRVPFLDKDLVQYMLGVPDQYKYPTKPKKLLVDALTPLIPDEIVHRPKMGFTFPWELWMRNELISFCDARINRLVQRDLFNKEYVLSLWKGFLAGKNVNWVKVWLLVVLEHWLDRNNIELVSSKLQV